MTAVAAQPDATPDVVDEAASGEILAAKTPSGAPRRPSKAAVQSSPRLQLERAPRLRRLAQFLDEQAHRASSPAAAHQLARRMRERASTIECGDQHALELDDFAEEIRQIGFASG